MHTESWIIKIVETSAVVLSVGVDAFLVSKTVVSVETAFVSVNAHGCLVAGQIVATVARAAVGSVVVVA